MSQIIQPSLTDGAEDVDVPAGQLTLSLDGGNRRVCIVTSTAAVVVTLLRRASFVVRNGNTPVTGADVLVVLRGSRQAVIPPGGVAEFVRDAPSGAYELSLTGAGVVTVNL